MHTGAGLNFLKLIFAFIELLNVGLLAVTFSRLEADGKLVMGYRKAPTSLSSQVCAYLRHLMFVGIVYPLSCSVCFCF